MRLEPALAPGLLAAIRAPFVERDATPIDAPVLQSLGLLLDLAGEQIRERLFVVQGEAGEERALRPDFTIPTVFAHIESAAAAGRYFYEGKAFRVAPAGSDRDEEFLQIGLEVFVKARHGGKIQEIPFIFKDRTRGSSKLGGLVIRQFFDQLRRLWIEKVRSAPAR